MIIWNVIAISETVSPDNESVYVQNVNKVIIHWWFSPNKVTSLGFMVT